MSIFVTAYDLIIFFLFSNKNSEKELELSVAASGAQDPEKTVKHLDFLSPT